MLKSFASDDGVKLVYGDFGPPEGMPVVLCHGLCASGRQFEADAEFFAGLGYRVLVPDLRGHGRSGTPAGYRARDFTIERMSADMRQMLDHAGLDSVNWVGNSLGGIVALPMLAATPRRLRTLATFGTSYALHLPGSAPLAFPLLYRLFGRRVVARVAARMTTPDKGGRQLVAEMLLTFDPAVGRAVAENLRRYDLIAAAMGFNGSLLLIRGGRDRGVNAALRGTLKAMEDRAHFTRLDLAEAGHCANLDAGPAVREALLRFWTAADGRAASPTAGALSQLPPVLS